MSCQVASVIQYFWGALVGGRALAQAVWMASVAGVEALAGESLLWCSHRFRGERNRGCDRAVVAVVVGEVGVVMVIDQCRLKVL